VPFDIPIDAFAVEVGGGAHPSIRSLGDRRLVYVEHRYALRRAYRRRQLFLAVGLSGAFVAVAAVALSPGSHAVASAVRTAGHTPSRAGAAASRGPVAPSGTFEPARLLARPGGPQHSAPSAASRGPRDPVPTDRPIDDRDQRHIALAFGLRAVGGSLADDPFLLCTKGFESIYAGGYTAIDGGGRYFGAYQFDQLTWNGTARHLERFDLVGVRPDHAAPGDQDLLAYSLYEWQGAGHWHHRCAGLP
jgi:Transglycosylase-like domain